mgnify:CR=1 FL=1
MTTDIKINPATGEVQEMVWLRVPIGTTFRTPDQQAAAKEWRQRQKEREEKEKYRQLVKNDLGNFYFILCENVFEGISPQTATKLIMLCSYLNYNDQFMLTRQTPMQKSDVRRVLRLSRTSMYEFWNEIEETYITERNGGLFISNKVNVFRHAIPQGNHAGFRQYQKIYIDAVRMLYNETSARKHKQLGYIFKLLPYINLEYNIFCGDPFEKDLRNIQPLTVSEICALLDYDPKNAARLLKELQSITFVRHNKPEYLISYVDNGSGLATSRKVFVNPHILYNGSDYRRVEILGSFCRT